MKALPQVGTTSKTNALGRYGTKPVSVPSYSPRGGSPTDPSAPGAFGGTPRANSGGALEKEYIYNLQQQIYFLELEMKYMREHGGQASGATGLAAQAGGAGYGGGGGGGGGGAGARSSSYGGGGGGGGGGLPMHQPPISRAQGGYVPSSLPPPQLSGDGGLDDMMAQLRHQYADMEQRSQSALAASEQRLDRAVQEKMQAQLSEQRAHEERARAEAVVDKLKAEHATAMQQVVSESVNLQRQLEHRAVTEKSLRSDVSALTEQLHELKRRFSTYDVDMRELQAKRDDAIAAKAKTDKDLARARAGLSEAKAAAEVAEGRLGSLQSVLGSLKAEAKEARDAQTKADGEARLAKLELQNATEAHAKLQDDVKFLIMENAQLQATAASAASAASHAEKERQRLMDEMDRSKVDRVLSTFMFRKQREKTLETLELHKETKDQIAENFRELARASQRYDELDKELRAARRRAAVKEEHYGQQEEDAAKLAQENRLLLERATQMGSLVEQLRTDLTSAQSEGDELKSQLKTMKDRDALAKVLSNFKVDDFRSLMDTNREVAGHIQTLLGALTSPAQPAMAAATPASSYLAPSAPGGPA